MFEHRSEKILKAIKTCGPGWHSRVAIAAQLGKHRLTDADVLILDYLVKEGLIVAEQHAINSNIPIRWEYSNR